MSSPKRLMFRKEQQAYNADVYFEITLSYVGSKHQQIKFTDKRYQNTKLWDQPVNFSTPFLNNLYSTRHTQAGHNSKTSDLRTIIKIYTANY